MGERNIALLVGLRPARAFPRTVGRMSLPLPLPAQRVANTRRHLGCRTPRDGGRDKFLPWLTFMQQQNIFTNFMDIPCLPVVHRHAFPYLPTPTYLPPSSLGKKSWFSFMCLQARLLGSRHTHQAAHFNRLTWCSLYLLYPRFLSSAISFCSRQQHSPFPL